MCTAMTGPTYQSDDEGIWDSGSDDGHSADRRELHREAAAREQQFYNGGYRDGLDIGKEQTLQEGFNIGFREGAAAGFEWGLLQGAAKTLAAFDGQATGTRNLHSQIVSLSKAADLPARNAMLGLFRHLLSQPMPRTHAEEGDAAGADAKGEAVAAAAEASDQTEQAPGSVPDGSGLEAATAEAGASESIASEPGPAGEQGSGDAAIRQRREAEGLADSLGALEVTATAGPSGGGRVGASSGAGGSGATGEGTSQARAPASALPEDALVMRLPDMPVVMRELRGQLAGIGFDMGGAPPVPLTVLRRRAVAAQDQEEDEEGQLGG